MTEHDTIGGTLAELRRTRDLAIDLSTLRLCPACGHMRGQLTAWRMVEITKDSHEYLCPQCAVELTK